MFFRKIVLFLFLIICCQLSSDLYAQSELAFEARGWLTFWSANPPDATTEVDKGIREADISPGFVFGPFIMLNFGKFFIESELLFGTFQFEYGDYRHYFYDAEETCRVWAIDDFSITGKRTDFSLILGYPFTRSMAFYMGFRNVTFRQAKKVAYSESYWNGLAWEFVGDGEDMYTYNDTKSYFGFGLSLELPLTRSGLFMPMRMVYFTNKLRAGVEIWDIDLGIEWRSRSPFSVHGGYRALLRGSQNIEEAFHGIHVGVRYRIRNKNRRR